MSEQNSKTAAKAASDRQAWDFEYAPVPTGAGDDDGSAREVVVATTLATSLGKLLEAAGAVDVEAALDEAPIHWYRLRFDAAVVREAIREKLVAAGVSVRYVASFHRGSVAFGAPLVGEPRFGENGKKDIWKTRSEPVATTADTDGHWFLGEANGVDAGSAVLSKGAGTRLAVIDDDAENAGELDLDALIPVGIAEIPENHPHGSLMAAWAVGACGPRPMAGVAPSASPRLYVIPKPGREVVSLAVAVARAVLAGADVIVCATYVESSNSSMLHDALTLAARFGRDGRGTAVVFPTGREASSPAHSANASWSLSLGDPAADARVFCISPGARNGGWFVWKDRRGRWHPFANRGPQVRWLAPGDDIAYPFGARERLFHAESSGASAIAAGVLLRVIASNPTLDLDEVEAIVTRTTSTVTHDERERLHAADAAPLGEDADGHNAKHGYGRMNAFRACSSASDPIAAALVAIGEDAAAERWLTLRSARVEISSAYSTAFALWSARAFVANGAFAHAARTFVRHLRLLVDRPERASAQVSGALVRHLVIALEGALFDRTALAIERRLRREVEALRDSLLAVCQSKRAIVDFESSLFDIAALLFVEHTLAASGDNERASGTRLRETGASIEPQSAPDVTAQALATQAIATRAPADATAATALTAPLSKDRLSA